MDAAHTSFRWMPCVEVEKHAVAIAAELNIGYSSQDWIDDGDTAWVVDINPGGQWLFLDEHSHEITMAIVAWLDGTMLGPHGTPAQGSAALRAYMSATAAACSGPAFADQITSVVTRWIISRYAR